MICDVVQIVEKFLIIYLVRPRCDIMSDESSGLSFHEANVSVVSVRQNTNNNRSSVFFRLL